jgi:thiamine biosynthesis protein ThiS
MNITVNGQPRDVADGTTISALIECYHLTPDKVAIEYNRRLLKTELYDSTILRDSDIVEIVTFVGGG